MTFSRFPFHMFFSGSAYLRANETYRLHVRRDGRVICMPTEMSISRFIPESLQLDLFCAANNVVR